MNRKAFAAVFLLFCNAAFAQNIPIVKFDYVQKIIDAQNDTTYILNFWATWCKPCVKELPVFNKLHQSVKNKKAKVILVSLDFKRDYETKLLPFVKNKSLLPDVVLLNEPDYNSWINKVNSLWEGAIPATFIINKKKHPVKMIEGETTFEEVIKHLN